WIRNTLTVDKVVVNKKKQKYNFIKDDFLKVQIDYKKFIPRLIKGYRQFCEPGLPLKLLAYIKEIEIQNRIKNFESYNDEYESVDLSLSSIKVNRYNREETRKSLVAAKANRLKKYERSAYIHKYIRREKAIDL
ncbi:hypothetical protein N7467_006014, partial [Penicillium canescens]